MSRLQRTSALLNSARKKKRYDLPLQRGSGGQLVAWVVGVMTFLTTLFLVSIFALNQVQDYWRTGITGRMTLEIAYDAADPVTEDAVREIITALNKLPYITARQLTEADIAQLVGPWLGSTDNMAELPLPTLIDVTRQVGLEDIAATDETIERAAQMVVPRATLDTHKEWLADIMKLAKTLRMILFAIALILALTAAVTVAATARTRLALHREEVDLLHLIGATDSYIATQFQRQAFRLATEGAGAGLVMAMITMAIVAFVKNRVGGGLIPGVDLTASQWVALLLTPLLAGLIAMVASRFTVMRALKEMP
jgi:cell division transport system permease protein